MAVITRKRGAAAVVVLALAIAALVTGPMPAAAESDTECVEPFPIEEVQRGLTGTGWTVAQGTMREPFEAEVLGVLWDGLLPGKHLIIVDVHSPAIEAAGGVWFGMSGSPVYVGERLLGAVSWGVTYGMSSVIGLTPGADLIEVTTYSPGSVDTVGSRRVPMSAGMRADLVEMTELEGDEVRRALVPLRLPVSISGAPMRSDQIARVLERKGMRLVPYAGASTTSTFVPGVQFEPGDSVGAVWSYGDITVGGTGTVAYVCENQAVLFGHSIWGFYPGGQMSMGGGMSPVIGVPPDPIWGSSKLSIFESPSGRVDQDRYSGMRMRIGEQPPLIHVRSTTTATTTGRSRTAETFITSDDWVANVGSWTLSSNIDAAYDHRAQGTSSFEFTITGTRASGEPFELTRYDMMASEWDIAYETGEAFFRFPQRLARNRFEDVDLTGVTITSTVGHDLQEAKVVKVLSAVGPRSRFAENGELFVSPRESIRLKVVLSDLETEERSSVLLTIQAPAELGMTMLEVGGGRDLRGRIRSVSFDDLLSDLENWLHNNDVVAMMRDPSGEVTQTVQSVDLIVHGSRSIAVHVSEGA